MVTASRRWLTSTLWWIPIGALIMALVLTAHTRAEWRAAGGVAARGVLAGAALGIFVLRFTQRFCWPDHFDPRFAVLNAVAAVVYSVTWMALNAVIESVLRRRPVIGVGVGTGAYIVLGLLIYVMLAGCSMRLRPRNSGAGRGRGGTVDIGCATRAAASTLSVQYAAHRRAAHSTTAATCRAIGAATR